MFFFSFRSKSELHNTNLWKCIMCPRGLDFGVITVKWVVYKWRKCKNITILPRSGWPTKITSKARCVIVWEDTNELKETFKQLMVLRLANVYVHDSTIRRTLNNLGVNSRVARRKSPLSKQTLLLVRSLLKIMWISQKSIGKCVVDRLEQNRTFWFREV